MGRLGVALTFGIALMGTSAQAAEVISNLTTGAGTIVTYPFVVQTYGQTGPTPVGQSTHPTYGGTDFFSYVSGANTGGPISFESSNVASGLNVLSTSFTNVDFTFTNSSSEGVRFDSLITPAGMGFYLADVNASCRYSSCSEVTGVTLLGDVQLANPFAAAGAVGFQFSIQDNGVDLFRVQGMSSFTPGGATYNDVFANGIYKAIGGDISANAFGLLRNFRPSDLASDNGAAHGFIWDATPVSFLLSEGVHNLSYKTTVFSGTNAQTLACGASLVAYSGFGDPIGRGGSVESADLVAGSFDGLDARASSECPHSGGVNAIGGVVSTGQTFNTPVLRDGVLAYDNNGVPEPATWAMMILGFGAIGATLRRRRTAAGIIHA